MLNVPGYLDRQNDKTLSVYTVISVGCLSAFADMYVRILLMLTCLIGKCLHTMGWSIIQFGV